MRSRQLSRVARAALVATVLLSAVAPAEPVVPRSASAAPANDGIARALGQLARWAQERGGVVSASIVDVSSGSVLAAHDADRAINPASNMKILTAAAALDRLGPDHRFVTGLYGERRGDTVPELVLRGHGDPSLTTADLFRLADALAQLGIARVERLVVDQSRFDDRFVPPAFEQQPDEWASFRAPVSAVALEQNAVTLNVLASQAGQPARAWFVPPGFVDVIGTVETRAAGSGQDVKLSIEPSGGRLRARLGGHIANGLPRLRFARRVDDPRRYPGYVLLHLLRRAGVAVPAEVSLGGTAETRQLTYIESAPLAVLLRRLGKDSDNFYAEMTLKALGAAKRPQGARSEDGAAVVLAWMNEIGAASSTTRIVNGSGLFDANRVSARGLTVALRHAYTSSKVGPDFVAQLAIGGVDGTLRSRFAGHRDRRLVRAKTGTLARSHALSGYVLAPPGKSPVAFSLLVDGVPGQHFEARRHLDGCVEAIIRRLWGGGT